MKRLLILLACAGITGCMPHFKEADSYGTLFRNDEVTPPGKGDPYTFGGIAEGSGGTRARQSYATDNDSADPRDDTARIGEIANERGETPGAYPGETGKLPGTGAGQRTNSSDKPNTPTPKHTNNGPASGGTAPGGH